MKIFKNTFFTKHSWMAVSIRSGVWGFNSFFPIHELETENGVNLKGVTCLCYLLTFFNSKTCLGTL